MRGHFGAVVLGLGLVGLVLGLMGKVEAGVPSAIGVQEGTGNATSVYSSWIETLTSYLPPTEGSSELDVIERQIEWKHNLLLWVLPAHVKETIPDLVKSWIVNMLFGFMLYLNLGMVWALCIYRAFRNTRYGVQDTKIPEWEDIWAQIRVSCEAIPVYTLLPPLSEMLIRKGYTLTYGRFDTVGLPLYLVYFVLYMGSVEFGVYWMHRKLHEVRLGYKFLHSTHHIYNKENSLSPFAGLAFNPMDGILQATPYVWTLALVPMHFLTHEALLFATAIWTTSIHDCVYGGGEPIMGAGYHLIHHTSYKHNYGHYLTFCDWMFGTLKRPPTYKADSKSVKAQ